MLYRKEKGKKERRDGTFLQIYNSYTGENGGKMKEDKLSCKRCKAEVSVETRAFPVNRHREMHRLGWIDFTPWDLNNFTLCPHCVHELKQFLAGHAISAVKEVR